MEMDLNKKVNAGKIAVRTLQAVTSRTAFCTVFLMLWFMQRIYSEQFNEILTHILFPWAAALAFPILTLRCMPKKKGYSFLIALFFWYLVVCFYNRQYSFYINEPFWYQLIFAFFIFYPQEGKGTLARMKIILYPFMGLYFILSIVGITTGASGIRVQNMNGLSLGLEEWGSFRLDLWCQPNIAGVLAAISGFLSGFFLYHSGRFGRVLHILNIVGMVLTLSLTQSRTTAIAWSFCLALLAGRTLFYCIKWDRKVFRFACSVLVGIIVMGAGWLGLQGVCSGALNVISHLRMNKRPQQETIIIMTSQTSPMQMDAVQNELTPKEIPTLQPKLHEGAKAETEFVETTTPMIDETPVVQSFEDATNREIKNRDYASMGEVMPRIHVWLGALRMMMDRPETLLFGVTRKGIWENVGAYEPEMYSLTHLHNAYLQTLVAGGLPSLLLMIAFGIVVGKRAWHMLFVRDGISGGFMLSLALVLVLVCCTMESYLVFTEDIPNVLFFLIAGCVMAFSKETT